MSWWAGSVLVLILGEVLSVAVLVGLITYSIIRYRRSRVEQTQPEQKHVSA